MKTNKTYLAFVALIVGLFFQASPADASSLSKLFKKASGLAGGLGGGALPSTPPGKNNISGTTIRAEAQNVVATGVNGGEAAVAVVQTSESTVRNSTFEAKAKNIVATGVNGGNAKVAVIQN